MTDISSKPKQGIVVDGWCSGNPGPGGYRAIFLETGKVLFEHKFKHTTNNVMEFCAIVHALKYRKENGLGVSVYSDSVTGISWVMKKSCLSSLVKNKDTAVMHMFIENCERWLVFNTKNNIPVEKWRTDLWGEIPADFGRK